MSSRSHPFSAPLWTDNLVLRLPVLGDEDEIVRLWNDPSFYWLFPQHFDGSAPDIADVIGLARSVIRYGSVLLIRDLEGVPLGTIHLSRLWRDTAEIGWYVAPEHRRRGIAREAARAVVLHLLENHNLVVQARMDGANAASRGLAESLGFAPVPDRGKGSVSFATTLHDQRDLLDREAAETKAMRPAA